MLARRLILVDCVRILVNGECRRKITVRTSKLVHAFGNQVRNLSSKNEPFTMKLDLDSKPLKEIFTPDVIHFGNIFERRGYELRIVGGAVRDILMHKQPHDLDFATTATPEQMEVMFMEEEIQRVNKGGERHGTVTAKLNDTKFETSTLRLPKADTFTPAEFTMDWREDAGTRDFTINSLFLGFDGVVYDYFNGRDDIDNRRVKFLTDPDVSLQMNPASILRYFRFYGSICQVPNDHDPKVLNAISTHRALLEGLSAKRIWNPFSLVLKSKFKHDLLKTMLQLGLAPYLGLPSNSNIEELDALFERAGHLYLRPITILTALIRNEAEIKTLKHWLQFSAHDHNLGNFVLKNREISLDDDLLRSYQNLLENSVDKWGTRKCIEQLLSYRGEVKLLTEFKTWAETNVPLSNERSTTFERSRPFPVNPNYNTIMSELQRRLGSDFYGLSEQQLQENIVEIIKEYKLKNQSQNV